MSIVPDFIIMGCLNAECVCTMYCASTSSSVENCATCDCHKNKHEPFLMVEGVFRSFAPAHLQTTSTPGPATAPVLAITPGPAASAGAPITTVSADHAFGANGNAAKEERDLVFRRYALDAGAGSASAQTKIEEDKRNGKGRRSHKIKSKEPAAIKTPTVRLLILSRVGMFKGSGERPRNALELHQKAVNGEWHPALKITGPNDMEELLRNIKTLFLRDDFFNTSGNPAYDFYTLSGGVVNGKVVITSFGSENFPDADAVAAMAAADNATKKTIWLMVLAPKTRTCPNYHDDDDHDDPIHPSLPLSLPAIPASRHPGIPASRHPGIAVSPLSFGQMKNVGEKSSLLAAKGSGEESVEYSSLSTALIFLFPALGGLLFGYDIGATSAIVPQLQSEHSGVKWSSTVASSSLLVGAITSAGMLGAVLGCLICFRSSDWLGRRGTILVAAVLYLVGAAIEFTSGSPDWSAATGISVLIVGRVVYGTACGFAMQGAPSYIGEMAPPSIRGLLMSLKEGMIVLGMLLGYSLGLLYSTTQGGWRATYGWSVIAAVGMFCGTFYLPESMPWLAMRGRVAEGVDALRFVFPHLNFAQVRSVTDIAHKAAVFPPPGQGSGYMFSLRLDWEHLTTGAARPALVAGLGLVILQQVTGQPSVLYYADTLFRDAGVPPIASVGISAFKLLATLGAAFNVDRYGRRKLLFLGCSLMLLALLGLGTAFSFPYSSAQECAAHDSSAACPSTCSWSDSSCGSTGLDGQKIFILVSLFVYIGGYQVGFGPVVWLIISEVFPLQVRGKAVACAVVTNFFFNALMTLLFPIELELIGPGFSFFLYAALLCYAFYFVRVYVPETRGLSLMEIEEEFRIRAELAL
ncbi:hypothetical protein B484DRAFT_423138 [Ochromonadaceae sp. CCMP2298]|nr:hypothetical protein B484DRAFT_423138 [Ochromonadaceae sp. CCMP2298]